MKAEKANLRVRFFLVPVFRQKLGKVERQGLCAPGSNVVPLAFLPVFMSLRLPADVRESLWGWYAAREKPDGSQGH